MQIELERRLEILPTPRKIGWMLGRMARLLPLIRLQKTRLFPVHCAFCRSVPFTEYRIGNRMKYLCQMHGVLVHQVVEGIRQGKL